MNEESLTNIQSLCEKILKELELLTSATKASALVRFQNDFLKTQQQQKIYDAIDGERGSQEIANIAGASLRATQLLLSELAEKDLINMVRISRAQIPSKAVGKIATYYAKQDIQNAGGADNG